MSTYPEHDKMSKIADKSQAIGEFMEWLEQEKNLTLCKPIPEGEEAAGQYWPAYTPIQNLLAEFFDIDPVALEREKRAMLDEMRKALGDDE